MGYNKDMFFKAFEKTAIMASGISPEHYYELKTEKYPHAAGNIGAVAGAVAGGIKGAKGKKGNAALAGAAAGGTIGYAAGHVAGKVIKNYEVKRLMRAANEMNLRSTPSRAHYRHEE